MKRILFLDFDGPLTNRRSYLAYDFPLKRKKWTTADPVAIQMLNNLYDRFKYETVLTTTWRKLESRYLPTKLNAFDSLRKWGFKGTFHPDGKTEDTGNRSWEIRDWLGKHKDELLHWASLDDELLEERCNPVRVHSEDGMSSTNYQELVNYFEGRIGVKPRDLKFGPSSQFLFREDFSE